MKCNVNFKKSIIIIELVECILSHSSVMNSKKSPDLWSERYLIGGTFYPRPSEKGLKSVFLRPRLPQD